MKIFRRAAPMLGLMSIGFLAAPLAAAPHSINDCEKIQAADAYNQCLASFGPVAHLHPMKPIPAGVDNSHHYARYHGGRGHHGTETGRRHGRQYLVLDGGDDSGAHVHGHAHGHGHGHVHGRAHRHHRH